MSDSEDEAAFASADEGEVTEKGDGTKTKTERKDNSGAAVAGAAAAAADSGKKDTAQSKQQKKKGNKGGKKTAGNEKKKTDSVKPDSGTKKPDNVKTNVKKEAKTQDASKTETTKKQTEESTAETKQIKQDVKKETELTAVVKDVKDVKAGDGDVKSSPVKSEQTDKPVSETAKTLAAEKSGDEVPDTQQDTQTSGTPEKSSAPPAQVESPDPQNIPRSAEEGDVEETETSQHDQPEEKESGGWGWGSWGSSLLTAASSSVSTFKSQVGEGFSTIVDSMESTLGAPPAEEIARVEAEQKEQESLEDEKDEKPVTDEGEASQSDKGEEKQEEEQEEKKEEGAEGGGGGGGGWFSSLGVSSLTNKIQNTGKSFVSGSLDAVEALATGSIDVLENIGKKTINVLSDHDPGFKKTKNMMFKDSDKKQNLSSLLREAKDRAEQEAALKEEQEEARKHNYGCVFDDFQGLAHLEALEILSNQSEKKVQALLSSLPPETVSELKPQLIEIKNLFELDDSDYEERQEHDFSKLITDLLSELHLGTTPDKLNKENAYKSPKEDVYSIDLKPLQVQEKNRKWIIEFYADPAEGEEKKKVEPKEIFHAAIEALAELTAKSVEQFHKAGELILLQQDSDTTYEKRSKSLSSLTQVLCTEVSILSTKFTQCLHKVGEEVDDSSVITSFVTNVYLEASNSSTYIQDGFQLLLPVLQHAAIQNSTLLKSS